MRPFLASIGIAIALALAASACGGGGAPASTGTASSIASSATVVPTLRAIPTAATPGTPDPLLDVPLTTPTGTRTPGQVRTLATDLVYQPSCYQLGGADAGQDSSAGVTMDHPSPYDSGTGFVISGFGPTGQGLEGKPTTIAWVESNVIKVEVIVLGGPSQLSCGQAYTDGYVGVPFQSR
jgi:hypothetical protein